MSFSTNSPAIIFIVDDDDDLRESLSAVLETRGYSVHGFDNAESAITAISEATGVPMIMMVDGSLPGMEGRDAIARVASTHPQIKIIAISGDSHRREGMLEAGAMAFFNKPIDFVGLLETIAQFTRF